MDDIYFEQHKIPKIDAETLKRLSVLNPWRSFLAILMDWLIIVLCIVMCESISYWFYPLAFVIAGTRFHGLEAMMHEQRITGFIPVKKSMTLSERYRCGPWGFLYSCTEKSGTLHIIKISAP
jgi:hypothetical protein